VEPAADPAARPVRRSFTAAYRARVVAEYEAAPHGQKAAVLRREGLYQSQIRSWTGARDVVNR
jgi:transposase-like protein